MSYWQTETLERGPDEQELQPVTRYAETDDVLSWLRQVQADEAPRIIVYRSHKSISKAEYEAGVGS